MKPLLIYAIGNPARGDDGLGPAIAGLLDYQETTIVYQPNIEDAELIKNYEQVLFIDAAINLDQEYKLSELEPDINTPLFSHGMTIPALLGLTLELYGHYPKSFLLALKGDNFELGSPLKSLPEITRLKADIAHLVPSILNC